MASLPSGDADDEASATDGKREQTPPSPSGSHHDESDALLQDGTAESDGGSGKNGGSKRHVRFEPVTSFISRLSGMLSSHGSLDDGDDDADDGGHNDIRTSMTEQQRSSRSFFRDDALQEELAPSSPKNADAAAPVGNRGSVILWRNMRESVRDGIRYGRASIMSKSIKIRLPIRYRKEVATILVLIAVATEFIGISISLPVLVQYAASFGVDEEFTGLVFSVGGFATFLSNVWVPFRSDRYGRKPVIVLTLIGSMIGYIVQAAAQSFTALLLGLFLGGMFGGTQPVAVAFISDIYGPAERPRFVGMVPACASVCFTLGPALGGLWSNVMDSFRAPIIFAAAVVAVMLPLIIWYLPDSKDIISQAERDEMKKLDDRLPSSSPSKRRSDPDFLSRSTYYGETGAVAENVLETTPLVSELSYAKDYAGPLRDVRCYCCLLVELSRAFAFAAFVTCIPLVLEDPAFGMKNKQEAVMYAGVVIGVGSGFKSIGLFVLFDRVQKRIGLAMTIVFGTVVSVIAFALLSFQTTVTGMAFGFSIFCFGSSMVQPGNFSYVTLIVPHDFTARAVAMPNVATSLGQTLAPIAASALLSVSNYFFLFQAIALMSAIQLFISFSFLRSRRIKEATHRLTELAEEEEEEEEFAALPLSEYQMLLNEHLLRILSSRNYSLSNGKAQRVALEIIARSFPYLHEDEDANEADLDKLMKELSIMNGAGRGSGSRGESHKELQDNLVQRSCSISPGSW